VNVLEWRRRPLKIGIHRDLAAAQLTTQIARLGHTPLTVLLAARRRRSVTWLRTVVVAPLSPPEQAAAIAAMGDARVVH
jgi:hypothetical protein